MKYYLALMWTLESFKHSYAFEDNTDNHNCIRKCRLIGVVLIKLVRGAQIDMPSGMWSPSVYSLYCHYYFILWNFLCLLFILMFEKYLKQYIYIYNVCHFYEIHLEFAKVTFHKHWQKSASLFIFIIVKRIHYICNVTVICSS